MEVYNPSNVVMQQTLLMMTGTAAGTRWEPRFLCLTPTSVQIYAGAGTPAVGLAPTVVYPHAAGLLVGTVHDGEIDDWRPFTFAIFPSGDDSQSVLSAETEEECAAWIDGISRQAWLCAEAEARGCVLDDAGNFFDAATKKLVTTAEKEFAETNAEYEADAEAEQGGKKEPMKKGTVSATLPSPPPPPPPPPPPAAAISPTSATLPAAAKFPSTIPATAEEEPPAVEVAAPVIASSRVPPVSVAAPAPAPPPTSSVPLPRPLPALVSVLVPEATFIPSSPAASANVGVSASSSSISSPLPLPAGAKFGLFLSHSWENKPLVEAFKRRVEARGVRCWIDTEQMAARVYLLEAIQVGIDESTIFAAFVSDAYVVSDNCNKEFLLAVDWEKPIVSINLVAGRWPPKGKLAPALAGQLYLDGKLEISDAELDKMLAGFGLTLSSPSRVACGLGNANGCEGGAAAMSSAAAVDYNSRIAAEAEESALLRPLLEASTLREKIADHERPEAARKQAEANEAEEAARKQAEIEAGYLQRRLAKQEANAENVSETLKVFFFWLVSLGSCFGLIVFSLSFSSFSQVKSWARKLYGGGGGRR